MSKLTVILAFGLAEAARAVQELDPQREVVAEAFDREMGMQLARQSAALCEFDPLAERHDAAVIDDALTDLYKAHADLPRPLAVDEALPAMLPFELTFTNALAMVINEWHSALRDPSSGNKRGLRTELRAAIDSAMQILGFQGWANEWLPTLEAMALKANPDLAAALATKPRKARMATAVPA